MIPNTNQQVTAVGTIPGKTTAMSIDAAHMGHIMNVLTNMYSDAELACIREYSANAHDSHVKGKVKRPIEVTLPTRFNPTLKIRDFGAGMSVDFMENRFSKYGDSTKRTNNLEVGSFGIGGKSALAYTDTFTITSVCNGIKGIYLIARDENGSASITTVDTCASDEPSGVEIAIPARSSDDFIEKAHKFFRFWPEGSVLVNGETPKPISGEKLTDTLYYLPDGGQSYVVMGNIAYRVANPRNYISNYRMRDFSFVAYVGMGEVSIAPNREDLEYGNDQTIATLKKIGKEFEAEIVKKARRDILDAPNHFDAWTKWSTWSARLGSEGFQDMTYKGDKFVSRIEAKGWHYKPNHYRNGNLQRIHSASHYNGGIEVGTFEKAIVVVTDKASPGIWYDISSYQRAKTRWFLQQNNLSQSQVLYLNEIPNSPWIKGMTVYDWNDVKKAKDPNYVYTPRSSKGGKVDVVDPYGNYDEVEISDLKGQILYLTAGYIRANQIEVGDYLSALKALGYDVSIIKLASNRVDKVLRENPGIEPLFSFCKSVVKKEMDTTPAITFKYLSITGKSMKLLRTLDPNQVADKELREVVEMTKGGPAQKSAERLGKIETLARLCGEGLNYRNRIGKDYLASNYPLIASIDQYSTGSCNKAELLVYLNASYKNRKKAK